MKFFIIMILGANLMADVITLGGGCFWCVEAVYKKVDGVINVTSGYEGGSKSDANYEKVSTGKTKHAEVVRVEFDKDKISLDKILDIFFTIHNPTTLNRQGNDTGTQYRSIVFYENDEQKNIAQNIITQKQQHLQDKIVTILQKSTGFYEAEQYHQNYFEKNPHNMYCNFSIQPKIEKLQKNHKDVYKK